MVRAKRRYFVFQVRFPSNAASAVKSSHLHRTFETTIARLYGDLGVARFIRNLSVIYYNSATHVSIVRCLRDDKHMLQTAATFIPRLTDLNLECSFQTLHVGGSIRQCKKYLVNYSIQELLRIDARRVTDQSKSTGELFSKKKKKKKGKSYQREQPGGNMDHDQERALQRLLMDSRMESMATIESRPNDWQHL